jgi:hypothetical protein
MTGMTEMTEKREEEEGIEVAMTEMTEGLDMTDIEETVIPGPEQEAEADNWLVPDQTPETLNHGSQRIVMSVCYGLGICYFIDILINNDGHLPHIHTGNCITSVSNCWSIYSCPAHIGCSVRWCVTTKLKLPVN